MFVFNGGIMKKLFWGLFSGLFFLSIILPAASAQWYDLNYLLYSFFDFGYYGDFGFLFMKIAIFILLFVFLFTGTKRLFPDNRAAQVVVSLVISLMAVAFLPADYVMDLGSASSIMGILIITLALLALPFIVMHSLNLGSIMGKWKWTGYCILLIAEILAIHYFVGNAYYSSSIFSSLSFYFQEYIRYILTPAIILLVLAILVGMFGKTPQLAAGTPP